MNPKVEYDNSSSTVKLWYNTHIVQNFIPIALIKFIVFVDACSILFGY